MNASDQADESPAIRELVQDDIRQQLTEQIMQSLGHSSAIFMSNPLPGTQQVMPEGELTQIGMDLFDSVLALISQTVSSVIGENEFTVRDGMVGVSNYELNRNNLRAVQRATAKRLLGRDV